jgi:hypothetical protein
MTTKLKVTGTTRKYADAVELNTAADIAQIAANYLSAPAFNPSFIAHISKPIGRKQFCYELHISKHLLDMWISGERKDPIERTREIMRVAAKCYGPDLPLDIAQELVTEFGGIVSMARKVKP